MRPARPRLRPVKYSVHASVVQLANDAAIAARIDAFVDDVTVLVHQAALEALEQALKQQEPLRQPRPRGPPRRRQRRSRAELEAVATYVFDYVKSHPGRHLDQIADEMKMPENRLMVPMKLLLTEMSVTKRGLGRKAVYWTRVG